MLKVRKATVEDLSILLKFHVKLLKFSQKFDSFLLADKKTILREKKELRKALKDNKKIIFLAEWNSIPIGYVYAIIEKPPHFYRPKQRGYIWYAFVEKEYRNKDVGTALVKAAKKWFKTHGIAWLRVYAHAKNQNSRKFWMKMGYKEHIIDMQVRK